MELHDSVMLNTYIHDTVFINNYVHDTMIAYVNQYSILEIKPRFLSRLFLLNISQEMGCKKKYPPRV